MARLLKIHDPDLLSLRSAARAALIVPVAFAVGDLVFGSAGAGLFAAFGAFAPIVFANFGGPPRSRAAAHLITTFVGAALIVLGTALSGTVIGATVAAFVVVFAVRMVAVFGGQFERAGRVLVLAFVIAVATSAPLSQAGTRVAAWLGAGALAAVASIALWPRYERPEIMRRAAAACRALAAAARDPGQGPDARQAIEELRVYFATIPFRPAGPFERDRAVLRIVDELVLLGAYLPATGRGPEDERFAEVLADGLEAVAARLAGGSGVPDPRLLEQAGLAHRSAIEARAGEALRHGEAAEDVLDRLDASFGLRVASYTALSLAANTLIVTGLRIPPPEEFEVPPDAHPSSGLADALRVGSRQMRRRLAPSSPRLRDALRGATGIAIAIFVALVAGLHHGLWVVLGTLVVLRSNALGTGRTALQAILATTAGFIAGSLLIFGLGAGDTALWIAFPFAVFLGAYARSATQFVTGQAAYTVFVLVLYNLARPSGWELGLVRLSHIAIGAGISLIVGVLLWPRGARETLRRNVADAYHAGARYIADALGAVDGAHNTARSDADRAVLLAAMDRLSDALREHLDEPGRQTPPSTWRPLLGGPRQLRAAGDSLRRITQRYPPDTEPADFATAAQALIRRYHSFGDALAAGSPDEIRELAPSSTTVDEALRARVIAALEACRSAPDERRLDATLRLLWTRNWLRWLERRAEGLPGPVADVALSASGPWWRS